MSLFFQFKRLLIPIAYEILLQEPETQLRKLLSKSKLSGETQIAVGQV